jgi:hypothetical protein
MSSQRELIESGKARMLVQLSSQVFIKRLERHLSERGLTVAAFAKINKLNPSMVSTLRHAPPKQLCVRTVQKFLHAFGMTPAEAETAGLFPRAGKTKAIRADHMFNAVAARVAELVHGVEHAVMPPVRIVIADTELTVAPTAQSVKPAVVEHLGWQLTVKRLDGATE